VELPFRLMMPDGEIELTYEGITQVATIRSDFVEVFHGPSFLDSHANLAFVGPKASLRSVDLEAIVPNNMPLFREKRTTILFNARVISDALSARCLISPIDIVDRSQMRRFNRAGQYLEALAFGHIPFINRLITAYRSVSLDPYAFEVTEWDVPVWYAEDGTHLVRIGLMPYWDSDEPFSVNSPDGKSPFISATLEDICSQLTETVAPGKLELIDALSSSYRGR